MVHRHSGSESVLSDSVRLERNDAVMLNGPLPVTLLT